MSFNAKDMTQGRSDCVHAYPHVQPDRQYHALLPVYFFWILVGLVLWVK